MASHTLSTVLAILACMIGGAMGGYLLASPDGAMKRIGLLRESETAGLAQARAVGGALVAAHAVAAALLGYAPLAGAALSIGLSALWFGGAASSLLNRTPGRQTGVLLALLMAASLASPFWSYGKILLTRGLMV
ncbi:hypothetical protein [Caulobacter sp. NIBR2454]|uniref:hypothetical protein n=1 Tax=Caulobacter sp. NIBR2454 TaxID=3015996 RepID=UPI0022B6164E|nr:hypothetical protein [Caulobacter sp. NIBR2454]